MPVCANCREEFPTRRGRPPKRGRRAWCDGCNSVTANLSTLDRGTAAGPANPEAARRVERYAAIVANNGRLFEESAS